MNKKTLLPLALAVLSISSSTFASNPPPAAATNVQQQQGWLGVYIRPMPPALAAQLANLMPNGEGILVEHVSKGSPAEKAGIKANDILLSFNDQKLYSPAQLSGLVRASGSGKKVDIKIIRAGKTQTIKTEIGALQNMHDIANAHHRKHHFAQIQPMPRQAPQIRPMPQQKPLVWDSFESVQVKTLGNGRYHAEIKYKDQNNENKSFTFEGKKDEIMQQIRQQKALPEAKKQALLNALNMKGFPLMPSFNIPRLQGNPFNSPFFKNDPFFNSNPFNDPFFKQPWAPFAQPQFRSAPPQQAPQQGRPRW